MGEKLNDAEMLSYDELLMANVIQVDALSHFATKA